MSNERGRRSPERPQAFSITSEDMNKGLSMAKSGLLNVNNQDLRVWELVTQVPQVSNIWAYLCFALNVILPGVGTMLVACIGDVNMNKTQLAVGLAQLLTSVYLLGWFISIYWGYLIVQKSRGDHNDIKNLIGAGAGNSEQVPRGQEGFQNSSGNPRRKANNPYED